MLHARDGMPGIAVGAPGSRTRSRPLILLEAGTGLSHNLDGTIALLHKRLEDIIPDTPTGPAIERLVVPGKPAEIILQQIQERRADLVVMSVHSYAGLKQFFVSSIVDAVLAQTSCPLLAVPFPPAL